MARTHKRNLIVNYKNLSEEMRDLFKEVYPEGYRDYLQRTVKPNGESIFTVPLETEDTYYLIKFDVKVDSGMVEEDDDTYSGESKSDDDTEFVPISEALDKEEGISSGIGPIRHGGDYENFLSEVEDKNKKKRAKHAEEHKTENIDDFSDEDLIADEDFDKYVDEDSDEDDEDDGKEHDDEMDDDEMDDELDGPSDKDLMDIDQFTADILKDADDQGKALTGKGVAKGGKANDKPAAKEPAKTKTSRSSSPAAKRTTDTPASAAPAGDATPKRKRTRIGSKDK